MSTTTPEPVASSGAGDRTLGGRRIVLGVTGGIAAYKAVHLARLLVKAGAQVDTVLSRGAERFVGAASFAGVTGRRVHTSLWEDLETDTQRQAPHIALARGADAVVVAPATAHLLAKAAGGLADDLLTNVLLMATCPVVLAPAMHTEMWEHGATQDNVSQLVARGTYLVGPAAGELAGGDVGEGRMVEPEDIFDRLLDVLAGRRATDATASAGRDLAGRDLAGRAVVVTAGGTREYLDPVRFLGNRSSGRMGFAIAREAARRGAVVRLVAAPTHLETPPGVERHDVVSARDMAEVVEKLAEEADVVVKAAAVADFRPASAATSKIKKDQGPPEVRLERNPDILAGLGARKRERGTGPLLVGFAAETDDPEGHGRGKLERKGADLIVVNDVSASGAGFEVDTNQVLILGRGDRRVEVPLSSKAEVSARLWDEVVSLLHAADPREHPGRDSGAPRPRH